MKYRTLVAALVLFPIERIDSPHAAAFAAANYVQLENAKPGTSDWRVINPGFASGAIEGYASLTSVNRGGRIQFFVNTVDPTYTLEVFRIGYYQGLGGRRMTAPVTLAGIRQPIPSPDPVTGLIECQWTNPYALDIPVDPDPTVWMSGVYYVKLTGSSGRQQYIHFVVRDDGRAANLLLAEAVTTAQAYNVWGGKSLYGTIANRGDTANAADKVSFDRPYYGDETYGAGNFSDQNDFAVYEWGMVQFLEQNGYDVSYATNLDVDRDANLLLSHKAFLSVGHDEYWSWAMRDHVEQARDSGVNLGFFSANTSYWQVRFENAVSTSAPMRVMVGYKEDCGDDPIAPANLQTCRFRDAPVNRPEDAMVGVLYVTQGRMPFVVEDASHWIFTGTGLKNGDTLTNPDGSYFVGYEVDAMGTRTPAGAERVAHSPVTASHANFADAVVYRAPSGATVFASGSILWTYRVPQIVQMTKNVLARLIDNAFTDADPVRAPLPSPWRAADIGDVGRPGFVALAGADSFTLNGGGQDSFRGADALYYASQPFTGDVTITARVTAVQQYWDNRAGLMLRESLAPDARYTAIVSRPSDSRMNGTSGLNEGAELRVKDTAGGRPRTVAGVDVRMPNWLRLSRAGSVVYAYTSADGAAWTFLGSQAIAMGSAVYVGASVSSSRHSVWVTASFDHVSVQPGAFVSPDALPPGWSHQDVGAVGVAGGAAFGASTFTIRGAGADVWGTADAFQFAYTRFSGDGTIVARVASVSAGAAWVKAGVMLRSSLGPSSPHGFMLISSTKGAAFQRRVTADGISTNTSGGALQAPRWVRLDRAGTAVTAFQSADGVSWTTVGSDTIDLGADVYAGLAVSSHTASATATATFDHVAVTSAAPPPPPSGEPCASVTLDRTFFYSGAPASNWTVTVTAPSSTCTWTAAIDQAWITLEGGVGPATISGTGSKAIRVGTLSNTTGAMRTGQFTIAGTSYKVTQEL